MKILASLVVEILAARGRTSGGGGGGTGSGSRPRHWILYIDSDAYLREHHTDFLARLAGDPRNADLHFALAREEPPAGGFRSPRRRPHGVRTPSMNAGILFVREIVETYPQLCGVVMPKLLQTFPTIQAREM